MEAKGKSSSNVLMNYVQSSTSTPSLSHHEIQVKSAEISLCGFLEEHNISFLTMDHLTPLLSKIFPTRKLQKIWHLQEQNLQQL